jgi:hypothetical protein
LRNEATSGQGRLGNKVTENDTDQDESEPQIMIVVFISSRALCLTEGLQGVVAAPRADGRRDAQRHQHQIQHRQAELLQGRTKSKQKFVSTFHSFNLASTHDYVDEFSTNKPGRS